MDSKVISFKKSNWNKTGQVTIFIIIAVLIVIMLVLIFVSVNSYQSVINVEKSPYSTIESCTKKATQDAIKKIEINGGDINTGFSVMYNDINRSYLCYTTQYYERCVNQRPKLIEHMEDEITSYITPQVNECFESLKTELDKRYQSIEMGDMKITTTLSPKEVLINIDRKFKMTNGENSKEFDNYKISIVHPIYNLAKIAGEITNQEAQFCNFDTAGYMTIYPEYDITKFKTGNSDTIYIIKDRITGEEFNFAIRSCVMPPGF